MKQQRWISSKNAAQLRKSIWPANSNTAGIDARPSVQQRVISVIRGGRPVVVRRPGGELPCAAERRGRLDDVARQPEPARLRGR